MVGLDSPGLTTMLGSSAFLVGQWEPLMVLGRMAVRSYLHFVIMPLAAEWEPGPRGRDRGES